jgi:hypothetical protein
MPIDGPSSFSNLAGLPNKAPPNNANKLSDVIKNYAAKHRCESYIFVRYLVVAGVQFGKDAEKRRR